MVGGKVELTPVKYLERGLRMSGDKANADLVRDMSNELATLRAEVEDLKEALGEILISRRELNTVYVSNPDARDKAFDEAASIADFYANADYCAMGYPEDGGISASATAYEIAREIRERKGEALK